ncbi:Linear gramicidin synthase subunit D [Candidatus Entotheonellaceae bacterium PAL068K]
MRPPGFRLSPQQRHLWLLQADAQSGTAMQQGSRPYCSQCAVRIDGSLDTEALQGALRAVVDRYEILRTTFHRLPEMLLPVQVIAASQTPAMRAYNLSNLDDPGRQARLDALFQEGLEWPCDGIENPLYVSLLTWSANRHVLLLRLPALCADMATLSQLVKAISCAYVAASHHEEVADEPMQYADLSQWLHELLEDEEAELEQTYWHKPELATLLTLRLPGEGEIVEPRGFAPQALRVDLAPALVEQLETFVPQQDTTVVDVLLACWQVLLGRLTGQPVLLTGIAYDGRADAELVDAMGLLTKYVPLFCHVHDTSRFIDVLAQAHKLVREGDELQEYFSWEQIESWAQTSGEPYVPYCFESAAMPPGYAATPVTFSIIKRYSCVDRFKVKLACEHHEDRLVITLYYDANRFQSADMQRLAGQFQTVLESAITHPEAAIGELTMLNRAERQQLLIEFNNTQTALPRAPGLHHLFEAQVIDTPDAVAVVFAEQALTYAALNVHANQLAHHLQRLGVGPETLVGLYVGRSLELIVGLLGILKAGAAYVPLDPTYPVARLAFMLADTQAPVIVTQQQMVAGLPRTAGNVICLDTDWVNIARQPKTNPVSGVASDNLAYVIYTSGSTGSPKGVMIAHRGLVNYLRWCTQAYSVAGGRGTLVHSRLAFDLTVTSLFSPLLVGQRVVLLPEDDAIEALNAALVHEAELSLLKITPAHLELLSQVLPAEQVAGRTRALIIGGEALLGEHLALWQTQAPDTRLINEYGPTETVVGCCVYEAQPGVPLPGAVPIGRPIANTQLYALDRHLQPVPTGVPGELYIGGAGVARGYLNQPGLTAETFMSDPFSPKPGARLYRSGDLVRHLAAATGRPHLEFLGRLDHQVKIRGFRIEPGEIEAVLVANERVRETVVVAREDQSGHQQLVAYVVLNDGLPDQASSEQKALIDALRTHLNQRLPDDMIPAAFVWLDSLPLTANGKVDREALPAPDRRGSTAPYIPPSTSTEEALAAIWAEVLGPPPIGIHDDFFALGGHSLLATQVISRVNRRFSVELTVRQLFDKPNVAAMAACVDTLRWIADNQSISSDPETDSREEGRL